VYISGYIVFFVVTTGYFAIMNGVGKGQTVGNRVTKIAVRDADTGEIIGIGRSLIRALTRSLLYMFLLIPGILSDLWPLWDDRCQTLADKACNSVVIKTR
jgi:uncharacterized RDD family membrane protein YckC